MNRPLRRKAVKLSRYWNLLRWLLCYVVEANEKEGWLHEHFRHQGRDVLVFWLAL